MHQTTSCCLPPDPFMVDNVVDCFCALDSKSLKLMAIAGSSACHFERKSWLLCQEPCQIFACRDEGHHAFCCLVGQPPKPLQADWHDFREGLWRCRLQCRAVPRCGSWSQDRKADKSSLRRAYWSDRTLNLGRTEEHEHLIGITQEHGGVHGKQLQSCATAASVCRSHAQTGLSAARHQQMPSSVLSEHAVPTAPFSDHAETLHVGAG